MTDISLSTEVFLFVIEGYKRLEIAEKFIKKIHFRFIVKLST
jgi:hypothetical protein